MNTNRDQIIQRFRARLNEFKRPLIELTTSGKEGQQATDTLTHVMDQIQALYALLKSAVEYDGDQSSRESNDPIIQVFVNDGVFNAIRTDPSLKEDLLRYLYLDLHMYPYTLNPNHINQLAKSHMESYQSEIVSNRIPE